LKIQFVPLLAVLVLSMVLTQLHTIRVRLAYGVAPEPLLEFSVTALIPLGGLAEPTRPSAELHGRLSTSS